MNKNYGQEYNRNRETSKTNPVRRYTFRSDKRGFTSMREPDGLPVVNDRDRGLFTKSKRFVKDNWNKLLNTVYKMIKVVYNKITKPFYFITKTKMENKNTEQPSLKLGNNLPLKKIAMWSAIIMAFGIVSTTIGVAAISHDPIDAITFDLAEISAELQAEKIVDAQQDLVIEAKVLENKETEARVQALSDKKNELIEKLNGVINAPVKQEKEVF
jgi:hypothetical protein